MGNFYTSRAESRFNNQRRSSKLPLIKILNIEAKIDHRPTDIEETSPSVLKYKTPYFRASATVRVPPLSRGEVWKIGWIQACTFMEFYNMYGNLGFSSWEFPELLTREKPMISDSDGKNYPWYGSNREIVELEGPQSEYKTCTVGMNDNFYPHITWDIPTSTKRESHLTNIKRHQEFLTWLVAMDQVHHEIIVLKTIKWQMSLEIKVDPTRRLGSRARLVSNPVQVQPRVLTRNVKIPNSALYPANANTAQTLVWRPFNRRPEIIVPPKYVLTDDDDDASNEK